MGARAEFAALGAAVALAAWAVAGFALVPLQQHRLIRVAPDQQNGVLALNASAIYVGQGLGAVLGSFVLVYASPAALEWAGATCAAAALIPSFLAARSSTENERKVPAEPTREAPSHPRRPLSAIVDPPRTRS